MAYRQRKIAVEISPTTVAIPWINVYPRVEKDPRNFHIIADSRVMQSRLLHAVSYVWVEATVKQELDRIHAVVLDGHVENEIEVGICNVHAGVQ